MPLPRIIKQSEQRWIFNSSLDEASCWLRRDRLLLALFLGTPCTVLELNRITIGDVVSKYGRKLNKQFEIRGDESYVGKPRHVFLTSEDIRAYLLEYLNDLAVNPVAVKRGEHPDHWMGFDPNMQLFQTDKMTGYSLTKRKGSYYAESLWRHIKQLLQDSGIESPSRDSGRRTFACKLHSKGFDKAHILYLLGLRTVDTLDKWLMKDIESMGSMAAETF